MLSRIETGYHPSRRSMQTCCSGVGQGCLAILQGQAYWQPATFNDVRVLARHSCSFQSSGQCASSVARRQCLLLRGIRSAPSVDAASLGCNH
jgi:hypothetical protein